MPATKPIAGDVSADKKRPAPLPRSAVVAPGEQPAAISAKPLPPKMFSDHGINDDVPTAVQKVRTIVDSHEAKFGYKPSPGHVFDVLRSKLPMERIPGLYDAVPRSRREARVSRIPLAPVPKVAPADAPAVPEDVDQIQIESLREAASQGRYQEWLKQNKSWFDDAIENPKLRGEIAKATVEARVRYNDLVRSGAIPANNDFFERAFRATAPATFQIFSGLALGPAYLAAMEAKAVGESVKKGSPGPFLKTNLELAKAIPSGIKEDFTNPGENAGYLFLDIFGLGSFGAGRALGAAAGRSAAKQAGRSATVGALKGIAKGSPLTTRTARFEDFEVELLNSENALVALGQRARTARANKRRVEERNYIPQQFRETTTPGPLTNFRDRFFSQETKAGRQVEAERRIARAVEEMAVKDLVNVTNWSARYALVQDNLPARVRKRLTRGENTAIAIESWDVRGTWQDRANAMRWFHEDSIRLGRGDPDAHRQKLKEITWAEQAMAKPTPRLREAMDLTRDAVAQMETLKRDFGLDDATMIGRVVNAGKVLTGEPVTRRGALSELAQLRKNLSDPDWQQKGYDIDMIEARISELREKLPELPRTFKELNKTLADLTNKRINALKAGDMERVAQIGQRLDVVQRELAKARELQSSAKLVRDEAFYLPLELDSKRKIKPKNQARGARQGAYGVAPRDPEKDLGFKYRFDGKSLTVGDYRLDTTRLVGDALGRTIRGAFLMREYHNLLDAATKNRKSRWDVPIRIPDTKGVPDDLRKIMMRDAGEITAEEARVMSRADWEGIVRHLYGATFENGRWKIDAEGDEWRWVDSRLLGVDSRHAPSQSIVQSIGQKINVPLVGLSLFAKPSYLQNLVGSAGMSMIYQGVLSGPNVFKARFANQLYGAETEAIMRELVGAGRYASYTDAVANKTLRKVSNAWNAITDRDLRVSALVYYLGKLGVKNSDDVRETILKFKDRDEKAVKIVTQAAQRAKKSMVEFDNLSWFEREYLRHFIFIYPWMRGSAIWNMRTIMERPLTSAVLAQFGKEGEQYLEEQFGEVKNWLKKTGYFPINSDDSGNPVVVNFNSVNTLGSIASLANYWRDPRGLRGAASPALDIALGALTGRDEYGREYGELLGHKNLGTDFAASAWEAVLGLPQVGAFVRKGKYEKQPKIGDIDIADRGTLISRRNDALKLMSLSPGWALGVGGLFEIPGSLITGSLFTPRQANRLAVIAREYKDLPPEKRKRVEMDSYLAVLGMQAEALGRDVPAEVKRAVENSLELDFAWEEHKKDLGNDSPMERLKFSTDWLVEHGMMTAVQQNAALKRAPKELDVESFRGQVIGDALDPSGELAQWDRDISTLAKVAGRRDLDIRLERLRDNNLGSYSVPLGTRIDTRRKYGKEVADYEREASRLAAVIGDTQSTEQERREARTLLGELEDRYDRDVTIDGVRFPPPARVSWAGRTLDQIGRGIVTSATQPWESLTMLEKKALGRDGASNAAWAAFDRTVDEYLESQPPGKRRRSYALLQAAAKYTSRQYDGFYRDWLFSQQPLSRRLEMLKPIQESPSRATWDYVIGEANKANAYLKQEGVNVTELREAWKDYVRGTLIPWLQQNRPEFQRELDLYGNDVLEGLVGR